MPYEHWNNRLPTGGGLSTRSSKSSTQHMICPMFSQDTFLLEAMWESFWCVGLFQLRLIPRTNLQQPWMFGHRRIARCSRFDRFNPSDTLARLLVCSSTSRHKCGLFKGTPLHGGFPLVSLQSRHKAGTLKQTHPYILQQSWGTWP